jgi:peptidoglycan/LPS O-acetylase OafA/YrhL
VLHEPLYQTFRHEPLVAHPPPILGSRLLPALGWLCIFAAVSTGLAVISWHAYEQHFLRLKNRFPYHRVPAPPQVAPAPRSPGPDPGR